jgi:hypothetical protein
VLASACTNSSSTWNRRAAASWDSLEGLKGFSEDPGIEGGADGIGSCGEGII